MVAYRKTPMYCILLGAPGAGKGTQAALLSRDLGLPRISSGELFREHIRKQTDLGRQAKSYLDAGELVPDSLTVAMVLHRLEEADCARGALLDGFPRTLGQAEALEKALAERALRIDCVLNMHVHREALLERLSGRWMCRKCGASFHTKHNPPTKANHCDSCDGELYQRDDDRPETVAHRLEVYFSQTAPLEMFYRQRGMVIDIDGDRSIEVVSLEMHRALGLVHTFAA